MTPQLPSVPERIRAPGVPPPVCNRGPRDPRFAGRDDALEEVSELLRDRPLVITDAEGLERSGKSAFALEYCHRFGQRYEVIWWFDARAPTGLGAQWDSLRQKTGPAVTPDPSWLTVYDGVGTPGELDGHLPGGRGHVLITCADGCGDADGVRPYPLGPLNPAESVLLLTGKAPMLNPAQATRLADALGHRPALLSEVGDLLLENPDLDIDACLALIDIGRSTATPAPGLFTPDPPTPAPAPVSVPRPRSPDTGEQDPCRIVSSSLREQLIDALREVEVLTTDFDEWIKNIEDQVGAIDTSGSHIRVRLSKLIRRSLRHPDPSIIDEIPAALRILANNDPALPKVDELISAMKEIQFP
ncbi:hypothetical protein BZB76_1327 [Actinomadura pelletieri DSM 43383]|uniref:Uncharacterized protein n=1 Tax=Actinomadura pelletieri DSM 43383 TaxID=1120940 RepID=A0A495R0L0_9ACTN|nr:hypothetical protein [Actinomadura pelletieri]RKS79848.1 hypothetical protein BZB76_1327 [Actinomadura pelletieri DSM 43383]